MLDTSPKMWGKELENEGAACIAAKWILPMLSLLRYIMLCDHRMCAITYESLKPKVALA